ncbi:enoyl-CoA hydratase [Burkholderia sp. Bp8992]|uniref:crotonase/enoyl-CoA hydratase family protein n=1 Tax=unclassified Burkholderia TaxID=2613784 RepID=UPI000F564AB8|nr:MULTISPECIES: crotonase/enoyl-CoA hydratase family protein [unclassified Burkholderia]RQS31008.1 enoyl-CoA hydratase [Burkholderia sp. Bp8992]
MQLQSHPACRPFYEAGELSQLTAFYEEGRNVMWMMLRSEPRPCFNQQLVTDIIHLARVARDSGLTFDFWVTGSLVPELFNVGGDLSFFVDAIRSGRRDQLMAYARSCIDGVYEIYTGFGTGAISIAMVEGSALGGGFEAALAHHYVLAQKGVKLGFPEIAFNLFPGMGGYSLVARKTNRGLAESLIATGEAHAAEWYEDQGLIDETFDAGDAYLATRTFIDVAKPKLNGIRAMLRARERVFQLSRSELMDITEAWVHAAFTIEPKDLAYMERLVMLQNRRVSKLRTV